MASLPDDIQRKATAYHEAGHAVIGRVLNLSCGGATIIPDYEDGSAGHSIIKDPMYTYGEWGSIIFAKVERGIEIIKYRDVRSAFLGTIMARMAGNEVEIELLGRSQGGDDYDRREIEMMAASDYAELSDEEWRRYEPRMRRQVKRLIRKHRVAIERVAAALLERDELEDNDIDLLFAEQ